jgi:hypothetical protein
MHMAVCWNLLASMVIVCRIIEMWTENQYLFPYTIGAFSLEKKNEPRLLCRIPFLMIRVTSHHFYFLVFNIVAY